MKNKGLLTLIGFTVCFTGFISIILSMIGVRFAVFTALSDYNGSLAFVVYMTMVVVGLLMVIIPNSDLSNDEEIIEQ